MNTFLVFPIHLFSNINNLIDKKVYLIEEPRFFTDFKYHKLKLAYHRSSMKCYFDYLKSKKIDVRYINFNDNLDKLYKEFKKNVYTYELGDNILKDKLEKYIKDIKIIPTLNFLIDKDLLLNNPINGQI